MCRTTGVTTGATLNARFAVKPGTWGSMTMTEKRLIDANELWDEVEKSKHDNPHTIAKVKLNHRQEHDHFLNMIFNAPTVDAVEVETIEAWLYEIAMNNTDNYLCDACENIICRLDGLRAFARERRTDNA